jgi:mono/diheme cytochrome c family protein
VKLVKWSVAPIRAVGFAAMLLACATTLFAQQSSGSKTLTARQALGRRIFQQRCGVCHTAPTLTSGIYGPVLYKDVVEGNEDAIKQFIQNGSRRMPGFRYGLEPAEIDAIVDYLKTVPKPQKGASAGTREQGPVD